MSHRAFAVVQRWSMFSDATTDESGAMETHEIPLGLALPVPGGYIEHIRGGYFRLRYWGHRDALTLPDGRQHLVAGYRRSEPGQIWQPPSGLTMLLPGDCALADEWPYEFQFVTKTCEGWYQFVNVQVETREVCDDRFDASDSRPRDEPMWGRVPALG